MNCIAKRVCAFDSPAQQRPRTKAVQKFFTWGSSRWPVLNSNRAGSTQARPADGAAPSAVCSALGSFPPLVLGSRRSPLALAQAAEATRRLQAVFEHYRTPGAIRVEKLQTTGDARVDVALWQLGGKGLFTKELDRALVEGAVDVCVHSMKDMPTVLPAGTVLAAVLPRQDPRDVLIFNSPSESSGSGAAAAIPAHQEQRRHGNQNEAQRKQQLKLLKHGEAGERNGLNKRNIFDLLPVGAVVGTTSLRRSAQLLSHRPDLRVVNFRGNVQRRISRLLEGSVDATLLALAGLRRLRAVGSFPNSLVIEGDDGSCEEHHDDLYDDGGGRRAAKGFETTPSIQSLDTNKVAFVALDEQDMLPAVAQGAVGLQCRAATNHKDKRILELLSAVNCHSTFAEVECERAFLRTLDGNCRTPIAGRAVVVTDEETNNNPPKELKRSCTQQQKHISSHVSSSSSGSDTSLLSSSPSLVSSSLPLSPHPSSPSSSSASSSSSFLSSSSSSLLPPLPVYLSSPEASGCPPPSSSEAVSSKVVVPCDSLTAKSSHAEPRIFPPVRGSLRFRGLVSSPDGARVYRVDRDGRAENAEAIGRAAANDIINKAGMSFLHEIQVDQIQRRSKPTIDEGPTA
eukprot:GHVT01096694.1.p1 GENE.GHVT01096694.1~~GHVT01096694.1.p1  ORF type:complete len:625 (+),score=109.65 GHVT01096694.1:60-1934(+)